MEIKIDLNYDYLEQNYTFAELAELLETLLKIVPVSYYKYSAKCLIDIIDKQLKQKL